MATRSTIRPALRAAREQLAEGRVRLRQLHDAGTPGFQVCTGITDLVDELLIELFHEAVAACEQTAGGSLTELMALVPIAGYGRRDLSPYSDIDLMFLHAKGTQARIAPVVERLTRDLFDVGLKLGHSVRDTNQALSLAKQDAQIMTSLTEARLLAGNQDLFDRFQSRFRHLAMRRKGYFLEQITTARKQERSQFGETNYLLEPNVKRSLGGLRGVQMLRWIGFCTHGVTDPAGIQLRGGLTKDEQNRLSEAQEFLLRIRNEMHFHAGRAYDVLDRAEQLRLAELLGYQGREGLLPVEQFMQDYFRRTSTIRYIVSRFVANARDGSRLKDAIGLLVSHQVEGDFLVGPRRISATRRGLKKLQTDLGEVLRLADLANLYDKRIAHNTWEAVRIAAADLPDEIDERIAGRFMSLLSQPSRLGELLRRLHELGVLEKIIPDFRRARCLLQFNEYHKYTVDEHSIRAVEEATNFFADAGPLGEVYRGLRDKRLLHLALLIHDLGKGQVEDHSDVGLRIATAVAERLYLSERSRATLELLVHKHLLMSHLALRRDPNDAAIVLKLAMTVGSPEVLSMLYVLTAADFAAVGPGVLNDWKIELLTDLYQQTLDHLSGDAPAMASRSRNEQRRRNVMELLAEQADGPWYRRQLDALPTAYLQATPPQTIADELRALHDLPRGEVFAQGEFLEDRQVVEYTVGAHLDSTRGLFHRLVGAISSTGHSILSAQINSLQEGRILDRFCVHDDDYAGPPPPQRREDVCRKLREAIFAASGFQPSYRKVWKAKPNQSTSELAPQPIQVRVDNSTSDRFTIIDVFAPDKTGLLFAVSRTLYEQGLEISLAKIGTYLDQVVDVFYVSDDQGRKILDEARLNEIRAALHAEIESFEQ